jgi:hypothetical protein
MASIVVLLMIVGLVCTRSRNGMVGAGVERERVSPDEFVPDWAAPSPDVVLAQPPAPGQAAPLPAVPPRSPARAAPPLPAATLPAVARALFQRDVPRVTPITGQMVAGLQTPAPAREPWDRVIPLDGGPQVGPPDPPPGATGSTPAFALEGEAEVRSGSSSIETMPGSPAIEVPSLVPPPPAPAIPTGPEIVPPCGTLADPRGQPIAGAHVIALGSDARAARSGADGRFCFSALRIGDTLNVWRAGFHPTSLVLRPETSLSLRMAPIAAPTPDPRPVTLVPVPQPAAPPRTATPPRTAPRVQATESAPARGERPDVYANESHSIRVAVAEARIASARARTENTARAYERAADRWEQIALRTSGRAMYDARFQSIAALRAAYHLSPTWNRLSHLRARLARFVATAPTAIPERITAVNWRAELGSHRAAR